MRDMRFPSSAKQKLSGQPSTQRYHTPHHHLPNIHSFPSSIGIGSGSKNVTDLIPRIFPSPVSPGALITDRCTKGVSMRGSAKALLVNGGGF